MFDGKFDDDDVDMEMILGKKEVIVGALASSMGSTSKVNLMGRDWTGLDWNGMEWNGVEWKWSGVEMECSVVDGHHEHLYKVR